MARPAVSKNRLAETRMAIYTRDGFACRDCGWRPVVPAGYDGSFALGETYEKKNGRRGARVLELDHIYPYLLGGKFEVGNLQALCSFCNGRKGATV